VPVDKFWDSYGILLLAFK